MRDAEGVKRGKRWLMLGAWAVILLLTACGRKEQEQGQEEGEYVYVQKKVQEEDILGNKHLGSEYFRVTDEYLYYLNDGIYRIPIEKEPRFEDRELICSDKGIIAFTVDEEHNVYYWVYLRGSSMLYKRSADGEQVYQVPLKAPSSLRGGCSPLAVDGEGYVYALSDDTLMRVDAEGKITGQLDLGGAMDSGSGMLGKSLVEMQGGQVWIFVSYGKVYEVMEGSVPSVKAVEGLFDKNRYSELHEGMRGPLMETNDGWLYEYRMEDDSARKLLRWQDCDIYKGDVWGVVQVTEDCLLLVMNEDRMASVEAQYLLLLVKTPAEEVPEKEVITLVSPVHASDDLEMAVVKFNRTSEQYHVTIDDYGGGEAVVRLDSDLTSENTSPDILDMSMMLDVSKYAESGALEDLRSFMGEDGGVRKEDYLSNLLEGYTINGRLVCIPKSFRIYGVYVTDPRAYDAQDWTMESMIAVAEKYPDVRLFPGDWSGGDGQGMLEDLSRVYFLDRFIDWESGECSFDSDEFRSVLAWGRRQLGQGDDSETSLLTPEQVSGFGVIGGYMESLTKLKEEALPGQEEGIVLRGFPSADGRMAFQVDAQGILGIAKNSAHKEGAWAFLQYYLQYDDDSHTSYNYSFPTRIELLELLAEEMVTPQYETDYDGEIIKDDDGNPIEKPMHRMISADGTEKQYFAMEREEIDALMEVLKTVDFTPKSMQKQAVVSIIMEEAGFYFSGDKTVEEVTKIIQNRVQILIDENR